MEWRLFLSGDDTLKKVTDRLDSKHIGYRILEVTHLSNANDLTARQEQSSKWLWRLATLNSPKKIKLEGLSERLGVSAGTLSEILRRAEKNISRIIFGNANNGYRYLAGFSLPCCCYRRIDYFLSPYFSPWSQRVYLVFWLTENVDCLNLSDK